MARYKLRIKKSAAKELEAISRKSDRQRIVSRIEALADNPRPAGCRKLSGSERYRIRQGHYRIVYAIEDKQLVVYVIKIADRKTVHRAL
ncbi:MAG: type II toxin-antitoxin system RelE/ParE family toxin [Gammaproteobacteria bacterium]|nr:type II toxin-antitoxin system RelE/ParE family toxin [Gammaproteobacteria bacterium]